MYLGLYGNRGSLLFFAYVQLKYSAPTMPLIKEEIADITLLIGSRERERERGDAQELSCTRPDRANPSITLRRYVVFSPHDSGSCHVE
jgi:hypothetical protein